MRGNRVCCTSKQGRKYKPKDKPLKNFLFKGRGEKDKSLRKRTECSNTTKKFSFMGDKKGDYFKREVKGSKARCSQMGKNVGGFSFTPASSSVLLPNSESAPGTINTCSPNFFSTKEPVRGENQWRAAEACPEIYMAEKHWVLHLEGSSGSINATFHFTEEKYEATTRCCDFLRVCRSQDVRTSLSAYLIRISTNSYLS